jgi:hypothetical protein
LHRIGDTVDRQDEPENELLAVCLKTDLKKLQTTFAMREDEPSDRSPLRNDFWHGGAHQICRDRRIGLSQPP